MGYTSSWDYESASLIDLCSGPKISPTGLCVLFACVNTERVQRSVCVRYHVGPVEDVIICEHVIAMRRAQKRHGPLR